ncbi:MAG: O-antigen ligase family protein, partial [Devosia sp.]
ALTVVLPCLFGFLTTYLLLVLLLLAGLYLAARRGLWVDSPGRLFFIAYCAIAVAIAIDAIVGGTPGDLLYALDFGMLLLYAPLASLYDRHAGPGNAGIVADLALAGTVIAFLTGLADELVNHPERIGAFSSDPIRYSDTAVILGFLALIGFLAHGGRRRWLYLLGPLLSLGPVLMSGSRSAFIAFPLMAIVAALLLLSRRLALWIVGAIATVFVVASVFGDSLGALRSLDLVNAARNILSGQAIADESIRQRLVLYRAGWQAFLHAPWLGVGWHHRMDAARQYLSPPDAALAALPHLHDEALNFAVGNGVVGVLTYLLLLALPIVGCLRSPRDSQYRVRLYGSVLLVASYFTLGLADVMIGFELHTALYVALTALLLSYCRDEPARPPVPVAQ